MGPLSDIKVIDFTHWLAGPYCTNILSDMGADVIKVEPLTGDQVRGTGSYHKDGESYLFAAYNHGKRSIALNLKHPDGIKIVHELCKEADVIVENYRPGTTDKLGIDYDTLHALNPHLIYCSITAYGYTPGYVDRPGMDPIIQGMGAVMTMTGERGGDPVLLGIPVADNSTAMMAFGAIATALYERERSKKGQKIDLNLIDMMVFNLSTRFGQYVATGESASPMGNQHSQMVPYQAFTTKDGWMMAGAQADHAWPGFCHAIGRPDLIDYPEYRTNQQRVENREKLTDLLNSIFRTKTTEEWSCIFVQQKVLHGPIWNVEQLVNSDVVQDHGIIVNVPHKVFGSLPVIQTPVTYSRTKVKVQSGPPILGEHTDQILEELGYSESDITRMRRDTVFI
jgi:crotonobetainyl-CoA:carnitine CoA-transferase CaiB-like acyl-CoA transferase